MNITERFFIIKWTKFLKHQQPSQYKYFSMKIIIIDCINSIIFGYKNRIFYFF